MESSKLQGLDFCSNSGLFTATGAETVWDTTVIIEYCINGQAYRKAATTDGDTPTTDINTGLAFNAVLPDKGCALVWMLDSNGNVKLAQGPIVSMDPDTDAFLNAPQFPAIPDGYVPFAYTLFSCDGTAAAAGLLPGTANWNAAGLTVAHKNVMVLPDRPQTS